MREALLMIALVGTFGGLAMGDARSAETGEVIGPDAVWQPGMGFMQTVRQQCGKGEPGQYGDCLLAHMPAAGAPPAAVAFSRRLRASGNGQIGYARDFRDTGRVDIAYVYYPLRANENQGWLLVNGQPELIDVDDLGRLPQDALKRDPTYATLAKQYHRVTLFPGDRAGTKSPAMQALPDGGQRFVVRYRLQNGCHACQRLGSASFGFDFDPAGRFSGARFIGIETAKQVAAPARILAPPLTI